MNLTSNYSDSRKYLNILYFYECIMRVLKNFLVYRNLLTSLKIYVRICFVVTKEFEQM